MQQIVAVIGQRKYLEQKTQRRLISWQTRILAQFIAATIEVEEGKENSALAAAGKIVLDDLEAEEMQAMEKMTEVRKPVLENEPGSYEKFMGSSLVRLAPEGE